MHDDDGAVDALLAALRADAVAGPPPGVWEGALEAAFAAGPVDGLADLVPVMDDDAEFPDEHEILLVDDTDDGDPHDDTRDDDRDGPSAGDRAGEDTVGPDRHGDSVEPFDDTDHLVDPDITDHPGATDIPDLPDVGGEIDLGGHGDAAGDSGW